MHTIMCSERCVLFICAVLIQCWSFLFRRHEMNCRQHSNPHCGHQNNATQMLDRNSNIETFIATPHHVSYLQTYFMTCPLKSIETTIIKKPLWLGTGERCKYGSKGIFKAWLTKINDWTFVSIALDWNSIKTKQFKQVEWKSIVISQAINKAVLITCCTLDRVMKNVANENGNASVHLDELFLGRKTFRKCAWYARRYFDAGEPIAPDNTLLAHSKYLSNLFSNRWDKNH